MRRFFQDITCIGLLTLGIVTLLAVTSGSAADTQDKDVVVAQIGTEKVTLADLNAKIAEIPPYARKNFLKRDGKEKILDNVIKSKILYLAAIEAGYDKDPEIKAKVDDAVQRIYQSEYFKRQIKDQVGVSDKDIKDYYDQHKESYKNENRVKVAHIQVDTEAEATKIVEKIKAGETFEDLAKKYSLDNSTNNTGGVLGFITKDSYIRGIGKNKEFEDAAFALKNVGDMSPPVKTEKGFHLIKLIEKQTGGYQELDAVKTDIANKLLVTEAMVKAEYDKNQAEYVTRARVKVKHIQVNTEDEAKAILKQLQAGGDFEQLAREKSEDKSSSNKGGDLGYIYKEGYIRGIGKDPEFERAAFELEIGKFGGPVQTKKGFHIVAITEKTPERVKSIDEVESQIRNRLLRDAKEGAMDRQFTDLRKKFNVQIFSDNIADSAETDFPDASEAVMGEQPYEEY